MTRTRLPASLALATLLLAPAAALAGPATAAFATCLADNTTGKDRKELAKWVFVSISSHPDLHQLSAVTPAAHKQVNQTMGALLTRLVTESCAQEARAAVQQDGNQSFEQAFTSLGRLAMQELMTNREVAANINGFVDYMDKEKFQRTFGKQ